MNQNKKTYYSPKLEVVAFDEEDILTVSTYGGAGDSHDEGGNSSEINYGSLDWQP